MSNGHEAELVTERLLIDFLESVVYSCPDSKTEDELSQILLTGLLVILTLILEKKKRNCFLHNWSTVCMNYD